MKKDYLSVDGVFGHEIVIERSRFITTLCGFSDVGEAVEIIEKIRKENAFATHNCYAYIGAGVGAEMKFSDDGEPLGTAGQPMLEVLKKRGLFNTLAVVTRFFGGVKLGAGGLLSAYTKSVAETVDIAKIVRNRFCEIVKAECGYSLFSAVGTFLKAADLPVLSTEYANSVSVDFAVPTAEYDETINKLCDATAGKAVIRKLSRGYIKFNVK